MRGWTKLGTHARSNTSIFKTTTVFPGKCGSSVLATCLCSQWYIVVGVELVNFLSNWQQLKQLTVLAYNTQQITKFLAIQPVRYCVRHWESITPVYLVIYGCCTQWFLFHCSYVCICLNHELQTMWEGFRAYLRAIKLCLPLVYPWHAHDKTYQEGLGMRLAWKQVS